MTKAAATHITYDPAALTPSERSEAEKAAKSEATLPVSAERLATLNKRFVKHARGLNILPLLLSASAEEVGQMGDDAHWSLQTLLEIVLDPLMEMSAEFEELESVGKLRAKLIGA
ncbi:MAG: hypothetical protein LCH39_05525 [Proteobacteria bacterium]|nr:hypothetical protein [Pseudomonadota bacterium]